MGDCNDVEMVDYYIEELQPLLSDEKLEVAAEWRVENNFSDDDIAVDDTVYMLEPAAWLSHYNDIIIKYKSLALVSEENIDALAAWDKKYNAKLFNFCRAKNKKASLGKEFQEITEGRTTRSRSKHPPKSHDE